MSKPETTTAGRHVARRKLVDRAEQRKGSWENDKTTLEMEGQLKVTKKNQSFLPLTTVQAGNKVAGAGKTRRKLAITKGKVKRTWKKNGNYEK